MFYKTSIALYKYTKNGSLDNERMVYMGYYSTGKIKQKRTVHKLVNHKLVNRYIFSTLKC